MNIIKKIRLLFLFFILFFFQIKTCYSQNHTIQLTLNEPESVPLDVKIGQMLIVGFRGMFQHQEGVKRIISDIQNLHLGGVILFDYDVVLKSGRRNIKSEVQLKMLINSLQKANLNSSIVKSPLFIAIDQEGGKIRRLKSKFGFSSRFSAEYLGKKGYEETTKQAKKIAHTLAKLGINLNFAPVVDVNINPNSPAIGKLGRSFSNDPSIVRTHALYFIKEHNTQNIICTLKHFPGHGSATHDSHSNWVDVTNTWQADLELVPYEFFLKTGLFYKNGIMVGHIFNRSLDEQYPATLSKKTLTSKLRYEMGYTGVIFSDDMQMKAISGKYNWEEAVFRAIDAGIDILVIGNNLKYEKDIVEKTTDIIKALVYKGEISEQRIDESYQRITRLKNNLIPVYIQQITDTPKSQKIEQYTLTIRAIPLDSRIRIMNIVPKYQHGIKLSPGEYRIRVDKIGYLPHEEMITIEDSNINMEIELEKIEQP
ncbi:MAG: glycoside hydrolase family 3 N-terminal domain-containing protein [Thiotrichaceae bacterium]|nr:glycoside hydrolase family 3 N-terminal domain-containing protein [Thiotrichaceae bacterium]